MGPLNFSTSAFVIDTLNSLCFMRIGGVPSDHFVWKAKSDTSINENTVLIRLKNLE
jgi:hypothetical protein